jgi:hypothetical protein
MAEDWNRRVAAARAREWMRYHATQFLVQDAVAKARDKALGPDELTVDYEYQQATKKRAGHNQGAMMWALLAIAEEMGLPPQGST